MKLRPPPVVDVVIAAVFVVFVLVEGLTPERVVTPLPFVLGTGAAMASLAWRRQHPVAVAAIVVGANLAFNPQGEFSTLLSLVLVCFTVGFETRPPWRHVGLALVVVPFIGVSIGHSLQPSDLAAAAVFFVGPWVVGVILSGRVAQSEAAVARAAQVEAEAELEAQRAAQEERTRIARELHDIVSHSLSVVTIQAQAVRRRLGPDHQREADDLAAVEQTAREALAEMRRLFGVLRTEGESMDLAPQPGLAELPRLIRTVGAGDLAVDLRVEGEAVPLSPGVDLAAYRIAQEGLTNALRHAHATRATVRLRYAPTRLDVSVEDDGRGPVQQNGHVPGHGLIGIRERVALYGGTVDLQPAPGGGTRLSASLPLSEERP